MTTSTKKVGGSRLKITDLPPGSFPDGVVIPEGYDVGSASEIEEIYSDLRYKLLELEAKKGGGGESFDYSTESEAGGGAVKDSCTRRARP